MVPVTFVIVDDSVDESPLEDVVVRVYSEDGLTFVTQAQTDEDGTLVLDLEDATTYWVRFFKIGYQFQSKLTIEVDSGASSNTFDVTATDLTELPPSTVPTLCRASGYLAGADLHPREGITVTFMLTGKPRVVSGVAMVLQDLIAKTDENGWIEVELVRGGIYDCVVAGQDDTVYRVVVPDKTSVSFTELVWPYVVELAYQVDGEDVTEVEVAVDETVEVQTFVRLSSGVLTPFKYDGDSEWTDIGSFVELTYSDDAAAVVTLSQGTLSIQGAVAGSTTISAEIRDGVEVERLPEPTRTLPSLTITVTE